MRILSSIVFRIMHRLGWLPLGRPDVVDRVSLRRWIRTQDRCTLEPDMRVQGRTDALEWITLGSECGIDPGCIVWVASGKDANPKVHLGDLVYVGSYCFLGGYEPLTIGNNTIIGAHSYIITANHRCVAGTPVRNQGYDSAPINIGDDVWIGCHVVILPGVTVGDHAVIGAGAVVNKDIPSGEKWAGVPARKIGDR